MRAVQYVKSVLRYLTVRGLYRRVPSVATSPFGVVRCVEVPPPSLPNERWVRLQTRLCGICGSDLATITAKGSPYFSPLLSYPFVLGHEIVATVESVGAEVSGFEVGERVVLQPALHCEVRGISPLCEFCRRGETGRCQNITRGDISPGIQTGYCRDTGGGWSPLLVAHPVQLVRVPAAMSDAAASLVEPLACSVHAVLRAEIPAEATLLVLGCGTMGLLTIAAVRGLGYQNRLVASAKYPHQGEFARRLGASEVVPANRSLYRVAPAAFGAEVFQPEIGKPVLLGGADITFECVGSSSSLDDAVRLTRSGGKVVLVGMLGVAKGVDWTNLWHKELCLLGAYAYGRESFAGRTTTTFELALRLIRDFDPPLEMLVTSRYPLARWRDALRHALESGRRGAIKTVFDFTGS